MPFELYRSEELGCAEHKACGCWGEEKYLYISEDRVDSASSWRPCFACPRRENFLTELLSEVVISSSGVVFKYWLVDDMAGIYRRD